MSNRVKRDMLRMFLKTLERYVWNYGLDPAQYFSSLGLMWDALLKKWSLGP